jgi:hypothetical protein
LMVLFKAGVRGAMRGTAESPCGSAHLSRRPVAAALRPAAGAPGVWVHAPAPISSVVPPTPWRSALAGVCAVPATSRDVFTPRPLRWARSMNGAGVSGCALLTPRRHPDPPPRGMTEPICARAQAPHRAAAPRAHPPPWASSPGPFRASPASPGDGSDAWVVWRPLRSTLHGQASRTRFVGCSLTFYYSRFCIRLHFRARTVENTSCRPNKPFMQHKVTVERWQGLPPAL